MFVVNYDKVSNKVSKFASTLQLKIVKSLDVAKGHPC